MTPPANKEIFESPIAKYWFDEDGILVSLSNSTTRTVENIKANAALIKKISNNEKPCLLVYITNSKMPDKQTRDYVNEVLPTIYKAMAMVSKSGIGEFIMNLLFALRQPPIPMKTFTKEEDARKWLKQYL
jgi:hypothetical protein